MPLITKTDFRMVLTIWKYHESGSLMILCVFLLEPPVSRQIFFFFFTVNEKSPDLAHKILLPNEK